MADRLISAEKLKEAIQKNICEMSCDEPRGCSYCKASDVWDVIYEQPTVDAEPVVRCKDCKCWSGEYCCDFMTTDRNGFCSWGERREDGNNN